MEKCYRCKRKLGSFDIVLCERCKNEWETWIKEKGFLYKNRDRFRDIRKKWYNGEQLP